MTELVDLNRAYLLLRAMSHGGQSADHVAALIDAQEHPDRLVRGLGTIINELVALVDEAYGLHDAERGADRGAEPDEPAHDHLHRFQPAIVTRLHARSDLDPATVPLMAAVLTAASFGRDCYEWRRSLGPPWDAEHATWAFTAYYLCDLIGYVRGDPDFALDMIGSAVAEGDRP